MLHVFANILFTCIFVFFMCTWVYVFSCKTESVCVDEYRQETRNNSANYEAYRDRTTTRCNYENQMEGGHSPNPKVQYLMLHVYACLSDCILCVFSIHLYIF